MFSDRSNEKWFTSLVVCSELRLTVLAIFVANALKGASVGSSTNIAFQDDLTISILA